ncbi:MAG: SpoIIE family protein phosphatase [Desulfuromonadales bacterium]
MSAGVAYAASVSAIYTTLIFLIAWYAHHRKITGRSIISNPIVYSLTIAVYCSSWTFYGSVGKAATSGLDFLMIYLGPSLTAFSWLFLLRRIVKISKDNNITSIADFLSLRYGKSPWLGCLVTLIAILGIMPYIALQIKAASTSFYLVSGLRDSNITYGGTGPESTVPAGLILALILALFSIVFGARRLVSSERHEGLMAAVAFESLVKLVSLLGVGIFVTYGLFDGFSDIFERFKAFDPAAFARLVTFNNPSNPEYIPTFTMLFLSMGAIMLLPRQFHVMVIENSDERHIATSMWLFPAYLFLINLFVMPIALGGILITGGSSGADFFVLNIPLVTGHKGIALLAFLGGLSAAAGMVMVESVAISTMVLNHIFMPAIVRFNPRPWFPILLINLKRLGIFLVVMLGYFYFRIVGDSYTLVNMGLISFSAAFQFLPAMIGGLYWRRGNKTGAISGILLGFVIWFYTLLLPSFSKSGWLPADLLSGGPFDIVLFKPTALFGLTGMDLWSHSLFWSMLFNVSAYIACSILLKQTELEHDQVRKFIGTFESERRHFRHDEIKRLSKPVSMTQFVALMSKFIGEPEAQLAISRYVGNREINAEGSVPEFELPNLKRYTEKTLAASVGAAAAGAIVDSFLSDMGSRMESVYDIFSTVRTSLDQSRESLFVRLKASEIINRTLDLQIIMDDLLNLLLKEFKLDIAIIQLKNEDGTFSVTSFQGNNRRPIDKNHWFTESVPYCDIVCYDRKPHIANDVRLGGDGLVLARTLAEGIVSCAYIPIIREGQPVIGIMSLFSKSIAGLFTQEFISLLTSLAGQLAQAITIVLEVEAKMRERDQKEQALLENARVMRDMEIARQIQISLLPENVPEFFGLEIAGRCISAAHVGGDYYDFFRRDEQILDLLIADVSGHSVGAALIMAEVRTLLRAQINVIHSASAILNTLNTMLYDDLTRAELFITMFYAKYNSATGRLTYSNAGHNHPLIHRKGEISCIELDTEGLIIGVKPSVVFEERSIELVSGDVLLFFTDGLTEAHNQDGDPFGTERICRHLDNVTSLSAREIIDSFYNEIFEFTGSGTLQDDVSIVALKIL